MGDAQGGSSSGFLESLASEEHLEQLKHFETRGLSLRVTPAQIITLVDWGHYSTLLHVLRDEPELPRLMFRFRRRNPAIGATCLQAWLGQPQANRINELRDFDPGDQEPLQLPDGSRLYAYLDAVAEPDHSHGPLTDGCFWLQENKATHRRRGDQVLVRRLQRIWRMEKLPRRDYDLTAMIPLVKEMNGRFFLLGISARQLMFGQRFPPSWKPAVSAWLEAPLEKVNQAMHQRIKEQLAATASLPAPVLPNEELAPYPEEFWPYLRRLEDGTIGVTEHSVQPRPDMMDFYTIWARQNKPPLVIQPDPRIAAWSHWQEVPVELRPFFVWDDTFQKPTLTHQARNDYERAMIQRAVRWNNALFIRALKLEQS